MRRGPDDERRAPSLAVQADHVSLTPRTRVIAAVLAILFMLWILDLIRRDRLQERYSVIWFGAGLAMLAGAAFPGLLKLVADAMGVRDTNVALFSIVLLLLLGLALNFSVIMSRQAAQITRLAQERAIERAREQGAREALEAAARRDRRRRAGGPGREVPSSLRSGRAMTRIDGNQHEAPARNRFGCRTDGRPGHGYPLDLPADRAAGRPARDRLRGARPRPGGLAAGDAGDGSSPPRGRRASRRPSTGSAGERRCAAASQGGVGPERALFVNVEPSSAASWVPEIGDPLLEEALEQFPLVVELTERALPNHTTDLIPLAEDLRRRGARIALDDVGTDPRSLALMPFLRPDVIKLDLGLLHNSPSREIAEVVHAVNAEAERTGALILAEGIETEDHLRRALALGASYGQGWLFGRPGELRTDRPPRRRRRSSRCGATPPSSCTRSARRSRSSPRSGRCGAPTKRSCSS